MRAGPRASRRGSPSPWPGTTPGAKELVGGLISEIGFDPADAGTLADGRRQRPGTPVYNQALTADEARAALAS